jgi:hypothetical protein
MVAICLLVAGCASTTQTVPEIVYVTDYAAEDPLPLPPRPILETDAADPGDAFGFLEAIGVDWIRLMRYIAELEHVIGAHNAALDGVE